LRRSVHLIRRRNFFWQCHADCGLIPTNPECKHLWQRWAAHDSFDIYESFCLLKKEIALMIPLCDAPCVAGSCPSRVERCRFCPFHESIRKISWVLVSARQILFSCRHHNYSSHLYHERSWRCSGLIWWHLTCLQLTAAWRINLRLKIIFFMGLASHHTYKGHAPHVLCHTWIT
jgi:hypothetical protein